MAMVLSSLLLCCVVPGAGQPGIVAVRFTVTTPLDMPRVPMDPELDLDRLAAEAGVAGVPDPNSVEVIDCISGSAVPRGLSESFAYGSTGRIEWVIENPGHRLYEIRFATAAQRRPLRPSPLTPLVGTGDLLRYNAGEPRPVALIYPSRLADLTGDGLADLLGCWNYAYRPGEPWSGVVCYARVGTPYSLDFSDLVHVRVRAGEGPPRFAVPTSTYMAADVADLNGDGLADLLYSPGVGDEVLTYLNSGARDDGGWPVFVPAGSIPRRGAAWGPCRACDLNADGAVDLVLADRYLRNTGAGGWPPHYADPVALDAGREPCFIDLDTDGRLDAVCLEDGPEWEPRAYRVGWRRNLGGDPPSFAAARVLSDIGDFWVSAVGDASEAGRVRLMVLHDTWQQVAFYDLVVPGAEPRFRRAGRAESASAVMSLSDQAWPQIVDWDDDGDPDLLVGGGYGWPRIVTNEGSPGRPAFAEARPILADGKPIRFTRDAILGGSHWHNMGYPYPAFVDWDADGLRDLVVPNETNRIFWFRNIGAQHEPRFGRRQQVICDGYPDDARRRAQTAALCADETVPNSPYPYERSQPFFWRTGAGLADWNADGLMDLVTLDSIHRRLTLFVQYRAASGRLHLRRSHALRLADGRYIDDSIVGRGMHWTESFRCADWDGDGLTDLIYGCAGTEWAKGSIYLLRNGGSRERPAFEAPVTLRCFGDPIKVTDHGPHPAVGDLDGDGRPDILACVEWSVYPFFSHTAITMTERPRYELGDARRL